MFVLVETRTTWANFQPQTENKKNYPEKLPRFLFFSEKEISYSRMNADEA